MKYNKLSDIVPGQVPQVVADEYPTFVAFLQAYYRFLETQKINKNIEQFRDIDTTLDTFITQLKTEFAYASPTYSDAKTKLYLPKLKQHFASRGSEESFELLFRLLFNKDVLVQYPKDSILKVSDGKWEQDHSIFVRITSGNAATLLHKFVTVNTSTKKVRIHVDRINVVNEANKLYEIFFSRNYFGTISVGNTITYNGFRAVILPTTTGIKVTKPGSGFKVGQIFTIDTNIGTGSVIKVSKITSGGAIAEIQKINFGTGYESNFYYTLSTKKIVGSTYSIPVTSVGGVSTGSSGYIDTMSGLIDSGFINRQTYFFYQSGLNTTTLVTDVLVPTVVGVPDGDYTLGGTANTLTITKDGTTLTGTYTRTPPTGNYNEFRGYHTWTFSNGLIIVARGDDTIAKTIDLIVESATDDIIVQDEELSVNSYLVNGIQNAITTTSEEVQDNPFFGEGNYVGEVRTQFYSNGRTVIDDDSAVLYVTLGAVAVYPGYYSKPDSFISGLSYIQDGYYYQDFSYVIKVDEKLDVYKNAVLQFLHPVGRKLFGEFTLQNDFILDIETVISVIRLQFPDIATISDNIDFKEVGKLILDIVSITHEVPTLDVSKPLASTLSTLGSTATKNFGKLLNATTLNYNLDVDNNTAIASTTSVVYLFGKALASAQSIASEVPTLDVSKPLASTQSIASEVPTLDVDKPLQSTLATLGTQHTYSFSKLLNAETLNYDLVVDNNSLTLDSLTTLFTTKPLFSATDALADAATLDVSRPLESSQDIVHSVPTLDVAKPLTSDMDTLGSEITDLHLDAVRTELDYQDIVHSVPTLDVDKPLASEQVIEHLIPTLDVDKPFSEESINTDTGTAQWNPYYSQDYFLQDYQEGRRNF